MKRSLSASLVPYEDSSEEESEVPKVEAHVKKRRLPSLPSSLLPSVPLDDPSKHQGRIRTTPHVEGQFAAYVYIPLVLEHQSPLCRLFRKVVASAQAAVPALYAMGLRDMRSGSGAKADADNDATTEPYTELHMSLTRPIYLRAHQREDLRRAVKKIAHSNRAFTVSLTSFSELQNDEYTRTFLAVDIGAGHAELKSLSDALIPLLRSIRQKEFYQEPRFHISIAWALLGPSTSTAAVATSPSTSASKSPDAVSALPQEEEALSLSATSPATTDGSPSVSGLSTTLISSLNERFSPSLTAKQVGCFEVRQICVKIGRETNVWPLWG